MDGAEAIQEWQSDLEDVSNFELYPYLVRLAVVADLLAEENERRRSSTASVTMDTVDNLMVDRLPKGTVKALRAYFKQLALDKQEEPVDPQLKRTYLAFYAQLLDLKDAKTDIDDYERRPELFIAKFVATVSKLAGHQEVASQGASFVGLLRQIVRKQGANNQIDGQLQIREEQLRSSLESKKKPRRNLGGFLNESEGISSHIAAIMLVSPTLFARDKTTYAPKSQCSLPSLGRAFDQLIRDLARGKHPVYRVNDWSDWAGWSTEETIALQSIRDILPIMDPLTDTLSSQVGGEREWLVPDRVRAYYALLLRHCLEFDRELPTLFSAKTLQTLRFVSKCWRLTPAASAGCLLHALNVLYFREEVQPSEVLTALTYLKSQKNGECEAYADRFIVRAEIKKTISISVGHLCKILGQLFSKPPKMGPYLQVIDTPVFSSLLGSSDSIVDDLEMTINMETLQKAVRISAEAEYERQLRLVPRDNTLSADHVADFVHAIVSAYIRLKKKYSNKLLGINIPILAAQVLLKLIGTDFVPLWQHCLLQYENRGEEPPFDAMRTLHNELLSLHATHNEVIMQEKSEKHDVSEKEGSATHSRTLPLPFNGEYLLFPYFERWAIESAALARDWVRPALEHDNEQPVDKANGKLYTSAVSDLFRSFHTFIKLVEDLKWQNHQHLARLLTAVVDGISTALYEWAAQVQGQFYAEMDHSQAVAVAAPRLRAKEQNEEWLAYARETTKAAVRPSSVMKPNPFEFKHESGAKINNIAAAYELLHEMESQLNTDRVSKDMSGRISANDVAISDRNNGTKKSGHLFTVTVISATDLGNVGDDGAGVYCTLVDQDSRRQLGKTRTAFGSRRLAAWNEPIELEVGKSPRLLRATVWAETGQSNHVLCGRVTIRLDPKEFSRREYGMEVQWHDLESGQGRLQVMVAADAMQDDIRFYFGKSLRFLMRVRDGMITSVVENFSPFIFRVISRTTLRSYTSTGKIANSVDKLQKSLNNWLGKSLAPSSSAATTTMSPAAPVAFEDCLDPLYDYLNHNFSILAGVLTPELRKELLAKTWDVVLEAIELLIIPPLHAKRSSQQPLSSTEMEIVYSWLSSLREFFYSGGAGPSLERLQNSNYQLIMATPVYYDLPTSQLKLESEKIARSNSQLVANNDEAVARQRTVMAHRNKSVIEHQTSELRKAQRSVPRLDDVVLRILRLRNEHKFIDQHLRYRERLLQRVMTERALGSFH